MEIDSISHHQLQSYLCRFRIQTIEPEILFNPSSLYKIFNNNPEVYTPVYQQACWKKKRYNWQHCKEILMKYTWGIYDLQGPQNNLNLLMPLSVALINKNLDKPFDSNADK